MEWRPAAALDQEREKGVRLGGGPEPRIPKRILRQVSPSSHVVGLFLIPGGADVNTWRRILHPTDFSRVSRAAFRWALRLGRQHGAEVVIMHVVLATSPYEAGLIGSPAFSEVYQAERQRWAERAVAELVRRVRRGGVRATGVVVEGDPGREIPRRAASMRADIVVMGTHGREGLRQRLFGSTAEGVIRRVACPVLTVRPGQRPSPIRAARKRDRPSKAVA
jgi:nucleotide-binding universal stress UspA family protein